MFPRVEYLHWMEGRPDAAEHDLGTTNQRLGSALGRLGALSDPPEATSLEAMLAEELGLEASQLLVTAGATHANFLAMATALEHAGDAMLVESPGYEPLVATPRGFGAAVERFERPASSGFALEVGRVIDGLTPDTALVVVTDRHNPSGRRAAEERLDAIAEAAADHGARLLVDEVYRPFDDSASSGTNFGAGTMAGLENAVVTGALTKFLGLGDLRIGWLAADPDFVERARAVSAHVPAVSDVTRRLAARVLADRRSQILRAQARAESNAALLSSFHSERTDLDGTVHGACPFAFPTHASADGNQVAEAAWEAGVLVVPGRFFDSPDRFRLAASGQPAQTEAALEAFGRVLDAL